MKIGLQGWHRPGKWNPVARGAWGRAPGYSEQTAHRTLSSPGVSQTETRQQKGTNRARHDGRGKVGRKVEGRRWKLEVGEEDEQMVE